MNKNSATPLYMQLVEAINEQIASGKLNEGDKLMAENEFSEAYGVSRITVRKALELLAEDGVIVKKQGIGTFVASRKLNRVIEGSQGFTETCERNGSRPSTELVSLEWKKASVSIAKYLGVDEGDRVFCICRIRSSDDRKVMLEENYFPEKYSYLLSEDMSGSLYKILRNHDAIPVHAVKTVAICFPDQRVQELLEVPEGQPLLLHNDIVMDADRNVIHYAKLIINPEYYTLTIVI